MRFLVPILLCGCGARTGLLFDVSEDEADASADASVDAALDAAEPPACEVAPVEMPVRDDDPLSSIWIANSTEGTVSKLDTRTGVELGRYRTGATMAVDPSRTSVDLSGAVYVGNRVWDGTVPSAVTKIAGRIEDCVDRNANGAIETSGGSVALPWGSDECVLWSTEVGEPGCLLRAVAVDVSEDATGRLQTVVYAGCWTTHRVYQLDAESGAVLQDFDTGHVSPYGFAVTAQGSMFIASGALVETEHYVGVVDLSRTPPHVDEVPLPECDGAAWAGKISYGIAADRKGRLWTCNMGGCLYRWDPAIRYWDQAATTACRGIAVGPDGSIWTGQNSTVERWDPETM